MNTLPQVREAHTLSQPLRARSSTQYITRFTPVQFLQIIGLVSPGRLCLQAAGQLLGQQRLPGPRRGRLQVYGALTIWLMAIIQRLWQKSDEGIIQCLYDHRQKRGDIERAFGILKRWYGLKAFSVQGLENVTRHALLTCLAILLTTLTAQAINRPDLSRSPRRLLADL